GVLKFDDASGHAKSQRRRSAGLGDGVFDRLVSPAAGARVDRRAVVRMRRTGGQLDLAAAAGAWIDMPGFDESGEGRAVGVVARRLIDGAFVGVESEPAEVFECEA